MPPKLTESELAAIEQRADLAFHYDDHEALRESDIADLVTEIRELWALRKRLLALNQQALDRLNAQPGDDAEADPP